MERNIVCGLNAPYPKPQPTNANIVYARLLMQDYAGVLGEMTAVTTYFYQSLIIRPENACASDVLMQISETEMRHMSLLGSLILGFGGDPCFEGFNGRGMYPWNSRFVSCNANPNMFIKNNIESERKAICAYEKRIIQIQDENARLVLERIILDEEHHIKIFEKLLNG